MIAGFVFKIHFLSGRDFFEILDATRVWNLKGKIFLQRIFHGDFFALKRGRVNLEICHLKMKIDFFLCFC